MDYLWSGNQMVQEPSIYADGTPREIFSEKGIFSWAGRLNIWGQMAFWQSHDNYADNDPEYTECHFRFAGQYEDKESGLYYKQSLSLL